MQTVTVIGAGAMGRGIAQVSALAGYQVYLFDVAEDILARAVADIRASIQRGAARGKIDAGLAAQAQQRMNAVADLQAAAQADLIIEAAPENLELKRDLFARLDELAPQPTILASNTSSLSINVLAAATRRPDRFLGLHFFNPAHVMKLVEVIPGDFTSQDTLLTALDYVKRVQKTPVLCKDTPAFIVNRVARPFYGEALRLLGEEVAGVETVDRLMESIGFPMGPFRLIDLIGCDVNLAVTQSVYEAYFHEPRYRPHPIQRRMVESGRLGRKTGVGFYHYEE